MGYKNRGLPLGLARSEESPEGQSSRNYARSDVLGLLDAGFRYVRLGNGKCILGACLAKRPKGAMEWNGGTRLYYGSNRVFRRPYSEGSLHSREVEGKVPT